MNNIDTSSSPVEQLWYTWSDVGLSTIHAGFRIRAASPGLTEIYSERVKNIERTMRYVLPPGTDRSITPDMAPVGLAFIRSEWNGEYLLIHKKYIGEDGVGRQGNFFAHALALGENRDFSTEDAIWQWEDAIWKTDSESLNGRSTSLQPLSINEVYNTRSRFKPENFRQVQDALQFVIEAYLMRKSRSIPIYIAAPANQVAKIPTIIAGLTNCLPAQLINGLTFSTYEPDIAKTTAEIVGTSWIPTPGTSQDATAVLPQSAYLDKLAINCETQNHSNLQNHPQILYNPLAAGFAAFAAENLAMGSVEQLYSLRDYAEKSRTLDISLFLEIYRSEVADTGAMDERGIEKYLNSDLGAEWLAQKSSRKKVIDRVIANPLWGGRLKDILLSLRGQAATTAQPAGRIGTSALSTDSEQMASVASPEIRPRRRNSKGSAQTKKPPITLADALALLAKSMVPEVKKYMAGSRGSQSGNLSSEHRLLIVSTLIALMDSCLLPQDPTEVWKQLFETIEGSKSAIAYLTAEWAIQSRLLRIWNNMFPPDWQENDRMRPLLSIPWSRLGDFLRLGLHSRHPQWVVFPLQELITAPGTLTPQIAKELEYTYSSEIATLLTNLEQGQHSDPSLITIGASLIIRLVEKGYSVNTTIEPHVEYLLDVLNRTGQWRAAKELVTALLLVRYAGSEQYQNLVAALAQSLLQSPQRAVGQDLVDALIQHNFPRGWLVNLLILINGTPANLSGIIQFVYPEQEGQNTFFIQHGSRYLGTPDYVKDMLTLYQQLLPLNNGKIERLFILLKGITHQETILSLLDSNSFTPTEWYAILEQHGRHYLQHFQQAPQLANIVVTRFNQLVLQAGSSNELLFAILPAPPNVTGEHYLDALLSAKELTIEQQASFLEQYGANYLVHYPKMPIFRAYISTYIANFNVDFLERDEAVKFFHFLTHNSNYKLLALDGTTIDKIEKWQIINNYFTQPTMKPQMLQNLAGALYSLGLPNNTQFTERLVREFLSCIETHSDILAIREQMRAVPKLTNEKADEYRFLYTLAEQAAEKYNKQKSINALTPYLIFALAMPARERADHFFHMFMDKLLYYVSSYDTFTWASLNTVVEAHGLSTTAIQRWRQYLYGLELWDKIASKSAGRRATPSESASRSSMPSAEISSPGQVPGEYSATAKKGKSSLAQRARSIRLPWQKEQALDTPPNNGALVPLPDSTQTMYPPMNNVYPSNPDQSSPTDARYSGTTNNNKSNNTSSSGLSFGHHQQDSNRRGK